jgi:DNA polymerase-3 subunit epsilon
MGFLRAEYERLGVALPTFPSLCTLHLAFRIRKHMASRSLVECCENAGVSHPNPHTAYGDAHATMGLMMSYLSHLVGCALCDLGCECEEVPDGNWLTVPPSGRAVVRSEAAARRAKERGYLSRLVSRLSGTGSSLREAEYLCLVDRVLEDRALTRAEADSLCAAAQAWGMSQNDVRGAHQAYLWALARQANADGLVTEMERRDLETVCELLGADLDTLGAVLDEPGPRPAAPVATTSHPGALAGKSVCFTGELLGRIGDERVTREMAEDYARRAGMLVKPAVTKSLDILVVADPDTQSGKAKKAREYGTRIMAEVAFWRAVGLDVE